MDIRDYREGDAAPLARLFFETVRTVNLADYSQAEVEAWAPGIPETAFWHGRLAGGRTLVAEDASGPLGFALLEPEGYVDLLYVRADAVGRGVGSALLARLEAVARREGMPRLVAEVSVTARPFFERHGYRLLAQQCVERMGQRLINFEMEKPLESQAGAA